MEKHVGLIIGPCMQYNNRLVPRGNTKGLVKLRKFNFARIFHPKGSIFKTN